MKDMNKHNLSTSNFNAKKDVLTVIIKFLIIWVIILGFFFCVVSPEYAKGYTASLIDKVNRLESVNEPKIILIGNSNVAFGIRSEMIEAAFEMPVINMGLHGGLDNALHEEMAKFNVNRGDVIIICHSEFNDDDTLSESAAALAWITIENHWELWKMIRIKDIPAMLKSFPTYMKKANTLYLNGEGNKTADSPYERSSFNEYGDNIYSVTHEQTFAFAEGDITVPEISAEFINRINDLNEFAEQKGATLLIAGYPIGEGIYTPDKKEYDAFEEELRSQVDCDVISHYRDYFIDYKYFYNTSLHLNYEGAGIRTEQLIHDLKTYFEETNKK